MSHSQRPANMESDLAAYFWRDERICSRSVSSVLFHSTLDIPPPPARLSADWQRDVESLGLSVGDIEPLSLARTIMRWPDYQRCTEAVSTWMQTLGMSDLLDASDLALMACLGTPYHFDAAQYGEAAFCNLFLSDDKGMDLHFPMLEKRIPLTRGTVVIFDTAQPHAVIHRSVHCDLSLADFTVDQDCTQVFLTWELPIDNLLLQRALHIRFDSDASACEGVHEAQVRLHGAPVTICPATGQWRQTKPA